MNLVEAVDVGIDQVRLLVESKANLNDRVDHQTALHVAAQTGKIDIVQYLIRKRADVNVQDLQGWTPLLCAAMDGYYHVCELLLQVKNIDVTLGNIENNNALIYLSKCFHVSKEISIENENAYRGLFTQLVAMGVDVNERNDYGETALHYATMRNNIVAIECLDSLGCNVNAMNK